MKPPGSRARRQQAVATAQKPLSRPAGVPAV